MTDTQHAPAHAGPIPAPPDVPATWDEPGDEQGFWTHDRMHWPDPVPLAIMSIAAEHGINAAAAKYDAPIRFKARRINTYQYSQFAPPPVPPDELAAMGKRAEEKIGAAMARLGALWTDEWLPEIKQQLAYWRGYDLDGASAAQLADHLEETQRRQRRVWDIHFEIALPMLMSMSLFDEMYRDVLGAESAFDSFKLLQGFENKTVESGTALWQLSREALRQPSVRAVLEEKAAEDVIPALGASEDGRAFLAKLNAYLDVYGRRADKFDSLSCPSWIEDPAPVVKNLKDFVGQPDRDLVTERAALVAERDQAIAHARERLQGYPRPVREQFEFLLAAAQTAVVLSEDHGYWIDYWTMYETRQVLLACGRRLVAAGALEQPDDTVHLSFDETVASLRATPAIDRRALVAERKAEMAHFRAIQPPPALGTMPAGPPPDDPMTRTMGKFFGAPPKPPTDPSRLEGAAGSPGKIVGTARVIRALSDAGCLGKGEILVAETTAPPWTPLFATAGAVVTDTGGILSHCAVVAREYGIPAVVGVGAATALIKDGMTIEVDGDAGTVRIVG